MIDIEKLNINLQAYDRIVIVDDDDLIRASWKLKLSQSQASREIETFYFASRDEFDQAIQDHGWDQDRTLFIVDYEIGDALGTQLIEQYQIQSRCYLVTGHSDDAALIRWCADQSVPLVAKSQLADFRFC